MEYNYLLPRKKEEEEEGEKLMFLYLFFLAERPFIYWLGGGIKQ